MKQSLSLLTLSVLAAGALTEARFVGPARVQAAAGENAYGVALTDAAIGEVLGVVNKGTAIVEAGAAIAAGALVQSDASGRAITKAAGITLGRLAPGEVAGAAGDMVEVILFDN